LNSSSTTNGAKKFTCTLALALAFVFALSFALLTITAPSAHAATTTTVYTVEEIAQNYANIGETASVVNFTGAGGRYYMVKISGDESVVLQENNGVYAAVANETVLLPLMRSYLQQQFESIGFITRAQSIKTNFNVFRIEGERCLEAIKSLIRRSRGTPPYMYITMNSGKDFPNEYAALKVLNATLPTFETAFSSSRDAVDIVEEKIALNDADAAVSAFNTINSQLRAFKNAYTNVSSSHTIIAATFPNAFLLQVDLEDHCVLNSNQTAAVDGAITQSSLGAIKTSTEMASQIAATTAARAPDAKKRFINTQQLRAMNDFNAKITNLTAEYAEVTRAAGAVAINLTILNRLSNELSTLHLQAMNSTENASTAASASFDRKATELEEKIVFFEATKSDYSASLLAVNNATVEVDNVAKKYGANDDRIASLQKDLRSLQISSKSYNDLLRDAMTTASAFQAVTANATALSVRAATLAPKENQLDFVLVGGAVILIAAVVGAFYYLRKKKSEGVVVLQQPGQQQPGQQQQKSPY